MTWPVASRPATDEATASVISERATDRQGFFMNTGGKLTMTRSTQSISMTDCDVGVPFGCTTIEIHGVQVSYGPWDKSKEKAHTEGNSPRKLKLMSVVVIHEL